MSGLPLLLWSEPHPSSLLLNLHEQLFCALLLTISPVRRVPHPPHARTCTTTCPSRHVPLAERYKALTQGARATPRVHHTRLVVSHTNRVRTPTHIRLLLPLRCLRCCPARWLLSEFAGAHAGAICLTQSLLLSPVPLLSDPLRMGGPQERLCAQLLRGARCCGHCAVPVLCPCAPPGPRPVGPERLAKVVPAGVRPLRRGCTSP